MARDLLKDLSYNNDLPPGPPEYPGAVENPAYTDEFVNEIEGIRQEIVSLKGLIAQVKIKHDEQLASAQQNDKVKQELDGIEEQIKRMAGQIRYKLKQLERVIKSQEATDAGSTDLRIRRTQHFTTTRLFIDVMSVYNADQVAYRDACKSRIQRQLEIAERPVNDEELENMLEAGNLQIFTQNILAETQQARQNLADIEARHEDIIKLEKSIRELRDLFVDMEQMVQSQGELINQIDVNVENATEEVKEANIQTRQAVVYKKKARKKKAIIIGVCVGVAILIIIIVVASVVPKK